MTAAQRVKLSDEVQCFVATDEDLNRAFAVLEIATDYGQSHAEPMTLEAALEAVRAVATKIEAMG